MYYASNQHCSMTQKFNPPSLHMSAWYEENEENAGGASSLQTHAGTVTIFVIVLCVCVCVCVCVKHRTVRQEHFDVHNMFCSCILCASSTGIDYGCGANTDYVASMSRKNQLTLYNTHILNTSHT